MTSSNRTTLLSKVHKVLKKYYKPVVPSVERPVLEQLLFACCLEDAPYDPAEQAFAALEEVFYDWNEVRVSTVRELADVMSVLPDPAAAAFRLKRVLQSVFEATYSFDLESLKKQNIGQAVQRLEKFNGTSPFLTAYVTQHALGGHAIPIDRGAVEALAAAGLVSEANVTEHAVPGLERAVPKNKGIEFGSLLHQLGVEFLRDPRSAELHKVIVQFAPSGKVEVRSPAATIAKAAAARKAASRAASAAEEARLTVEKGPAPNKKKAAAGKNPEKPKEEAPAKGKATSTSKLAKQKPR
jgi:hypothetical protein